MVARHHRSNTDSGHHTGARISLKSPYDAAFSPPMAAFLWHGDGTEIRPSVVA
jgi:hypothetical protein